MFLYLWKYHFSISLPGLFWREYFLCEKQKMGGFRKIPVMWPISKMSNSKKNQNQNSFNEIRVTMLTLNQCMINELWNIFTAPGLLYLFCFLICTTIIVLSVVSKQLLPYLDITGNCNLHYAVSNDVFEVVIVRHHLAIFFLIAFYRKSFIRFLVSIRIGFSLLCIWASWVSLCISWVADETSRMEALGRP